MNELKNTVEAFNLYQRAIGNSPATLEYYKYCLNPFVKHFGIEFDVNGFTKQNLRQYAANMRNSALSSNSIKTYSKGIRVFLTWLFNEGYVQYNPAEYYQLPKAKRKIIEILTADELKQLFESFDVTEHLGLRNYIICGLMYGSGLKKSEVINVNRESVNIVSGTIKVNGKGNKQRIVPMSAMVKSMIQNYIGIYGYRLQGCMFLTNAGNSITTTCIDRLFKTLKSSLSIPRIHAHLLRHTYATNYLMNGGDITDLMELLGHSDIETVLIYLHIAKNHCINNFAKYSPLDQLRLYQNKEGATS